MKFGVWTDYEFACKLCT